MPGIATVTAIAAAHTAALRSPVSAFFEEQATCERLVGEQPHHTAVGQFMKFHNACVFKNAIRPTKIQYHNSVG